MKALVIMIFMIIVIGLYFLKVSVHKERIKEKVNFLGGNVINIEKRTFRTGPFILTGKGTMVYRIEYRVGDMEKEGWVKFGGLLGPDWRL